MVKTCESVYENICEQMYSKSVRECSDYELYIAMLNLVNKMVDENKQTQKDSVKKVYYISAEFLIGKMMSNNLINLGIYDEMKQFLEKNGHNISELEEIENEPSLGNGGLGRLAACFLDSMATIGLNGDGIGLRYHYGLFRQKFENNSQTEQPDKWMDVESWDRRTSTEFNVDFGKFSVKSVMYDIPVMGYHNRTNNLHLFDIDTVSDSVLKNSGIEFDETDVNKNLTLFLYPDDSTENGRLLRIYQEYFLVSSAAQLILSDVKKKCSDSQDSILNMKKYAAIQINDTHPTMVIPELIRLMIKDGDVNGNSICMDDAIKAVTESCAYTNHTILAEALETWPIEYLEKAAPLIVPVIKELDKRVKEKYEDKTVHIIDESQRVHMAFIDIHYGYSVNGVAMLHTEILKNSELKNFYDIYPEKFNNKTNGITFRRWLLYCNHELADYIEELIGADFKKDADKLEKLMEYSDNDGVIKRMLEIKYNNKKNLANYLKRTMDIDINPDSVYDIQVKRLHEYKRQQMNALYIIYKYFQIKEGNIPKRPITVIFGAKAAPAYTIAKDIIHLILCLSELINNDPEVSPYLKVVMVENYNVTLAEKLIPACDISEQISLASKEASGTGNMKFMLNGAITLGTMDGANVEIADLVGEENIYTFGASSDEVIAHYKNSDYCARDIYNDNEDVKKYVDFIISDELVKLGDKEKLERLYKEIVGKDWFMALLDLKEYIKTRDKALNDYEDRENWGRKMLVNTAMAGYFSSDRTIKQYNEDIWRA